MYIIAIAWLYVTVLMAATEKTVAAGLLTFVFYGLLPCAILLWVLGVKHRKFKRKFNQKFKSAVKLNNEHLLNDGVREPDGANAKTDE
jgi:Flp pilus assembly protein TadB